MIKNKERQKKSDERREMVIKNGKEMVIKIKRIEG